VALERKAADKMRIKIFLSKVFGEKKINALELSSNKLDNNVAGLVTDGLGGWM
jgi:hypothetical protein